MNKVIVFKLLAKIKGGTQAGFQLWKSIPTKALMEGLGWILWTQCPWYLKPAMVAIWLRGFYYTLRGIMILCIKIHNFFSWFKKTVKTLLRLRFKLF